MSVVNIISAIGNNSSIYPLLVRDCGIENPIKLGLTYQQNLKDSKKMADNALRERAIDEYICSLIWLGGIPVMDRICNWGIKKLGYDPNIDMNLLKADSKQGLDINIKIFQDKAEKEVKSLKKVLDNPKTYEKLQAGKFILSTAIPVLLMGFCLPKLNFALTDKLRKKEENNKVNKNLDLENSPNNNISFKGNVISTLANMSTVNKMAVTDGGLTVGRVGTGRNINERLELGFKMLGMMFLNFVAPKWIARFFDSASNKLFNTNVNLDPKVLNRKEFLSAIKNNTLELPENNKIIEFLDKNPSSMFSKLCEEFCGVKFLNNNVRDPRKFINERELETFKNEIIKFSNSAKKSGNIDKFAQKALFVKSGNIIANVIISSILLAICLPKLTFYLRKLITGSDAEPGLIQKN